MAENKEKKGFGKFFDSFKKKDKTPTTQDNITTTTQISQQDQDGLTGVAELCKTYGIAYDALGEVSAELKELQENAEENKTLLSEYKNFIRDIEVTAQSKLLALREYELALSLAEAETEQQAKDAGTETETATETPPPPTRKPVNSEIIICKTSDNMRAWLFVFPPFFDGDDVTIESIQAKMMLEKITSGIVENTAENLVNNKSYLKVFNLAIGTHATDGQDGKIEEVVSREKGVDIQEDEHGKIDFKELNLIKRVSAGDVLCKILPPTDAVDGVDISGDIIVAKKGSAVSIPKGKNTKLSEDGTELLAEIDGHVEVNSSDAYCVENVLSIAGDVDLSTGNVTFDGNIVIGGIVHEGFSVVSDSSITIKGGVAPNAIIKAGRDITVARGVNGGTKGRLEAGGKIKIKYIENCSINAGDSIEAEVITNSRIECDNSLTVTKGKGTIVGGTYTVGKLMEVKNLGNENSSIPILITLGVKPNLLRERDELAKQFAETMRKYDQLVKSIDYMRTVSTEGITPERKALFSKTLLQFKFVAAQKEKEEKILAEKEAELSEVSYCRVKATNAFPGTTVKIGNEQYVVKQTTKGLEFNNSEEVRR